MKIQPHDHPATTARNYEQQPITLPQHTVSCIHHIAGLGNITTTQQTNTMQNEAMKKFQNSEDVHK